MPVDTWTEDRISELKKLWAEGHSTTRIGIALGLRRNAVVGKVWRLRLPTPAFKLPIVSDRTYSRQCPEITRANRIAAQRRYIAKKRANQPVSPTSAFSRRQHGIQAMTRNELRAMLTQAVRNTAALS